MKTRARYYWDYRIRKTGKRGALVQYIAEYTPLFVCCECGKLGSNKKIKNHSSLFYRLACSEICTPPEHFDFKGNYYLCGKCWGKWSVLLRLYMTAYEIGYQARKLKREEYHGRKNKHEANEGNTGGRNRKSIEGQSACC